MTSAEEEAKEIAGVYHDLVTDYGFKVQSLSDDGSAVVYEDSAGYQITVYADRSVGWFCQPKDGKGFQGLSYIDLMAVLSPEGRNF
jgi:hypothetical protein